MSLIDPVFAEYRIVDIAGVLTGKGAGTHRDSGAQRNIDRTAHVVAELGAVMNAAGAVERALRSAQYLHPRQIAGIQIGLHIAVNAGQATVNRYIVDGDRDGRGGVSA